MRGTVYIDRETTDGDRGTVRTLDVEGFSSTLGDPIDVIKKAVHDALIDPENHAYTVRAIHDDGWNLRVIHRESYGDRKWIDNPGEAARMSDRPSNLVSYFGGYASGIQAGDRRVHILRDSDRETFCGLVDRCGYGTPSVVGQLSRRSCEACFREAQEVRRDV